MATRREREEALSAPVDPETTPIDATTAEIIILHADQLTGPYALVPVFDTLQQEAGNDKVGKALSASVKRLVAILEPGRSKMTSRMARPSLLARLVLRGGDHVQIARIILALAERKNDDSDIIIQILLRDLDPKAIPPETIRSVLTKTVSQNTDTRKARTVFLAKAIEDLTATHALELLQSAGSDQAQKEILIEAILASGTIEDLEAALKIDPRNEKISTILQRKRLVRAAREAVGKIVNP